MFDEPTGADVSTIENYVNGQRVAPSSDRTQNVYNPATGKNTSIVTMSTAADVDAAVEAASAAFPA